MMKFGMFLLFVFVCLIVFLVFRRNVDERIDEDLEEEIENEKRILEETAISLTPQEFFKLYKRSLGQDNREPLFGDSLNFEGIYILYNLTKDKYYVGQSVNVMKRVNMHFGGKHSGNKSVYKDFVKGDKWNIKLISMKETNYTNLNDLEKYAITLYKAYTNGYNKTRGNKS